MKNMDIVQLLFLKNTSKNLTKSSSEFFKKQNISNGELFEFRTEQTDDLKIGHHLTADDT